MDKEEADSEWPAPAQPGDRLSFTNGELRQRTRRGDADIDMAQGRLEDTRLQNQKKVIKLLTWTLLGS